MDYGSIICTPRNPNCSICTIKQYCLSYEKNIQNIIPVKVNTKIAKPEKYTRAYVVLNEKKEILVRIRASKGMLASMLEVPNDNWEEEKLLLKKDKLIKEMKLKFKKKGSLLYPFSHFNLNADIFYTEINTKNYPNQKWLKLSKYSSSRLPTIKKKIVSIAI